MGRLRVMAISLISSLMQSLNVPAGTVMSSVPRVVILTWPVAFESTAPLDFD